MIDANIAQATPSVQHLQTVYCPMCEAVHERNTWCQAPDMTMEGQS